MAKQTRSLERRQTRRAHGIEANSNKQQRQHQQRELPIREAKVRLDDFGANLDQRSADEDAGGETRKPPEGAHPAGHVAEEALVLGRCELGDPVVLSAAGGRHAGHFGEGGDDGGVAEYGADEGPEEAAEASVDEAGGERDEDEFPGGHVD